MNAETGHGRNKACTECRQQKLRCDASSRGYSQPCSRCQRRGFRCEIKSSFKREKKKTKAQLLQEVNKLKEQLKTPGADTSVSEPQTALTEIGGRRWSSVSGINTPQPALNSNVWSDPMITQPNSEIESASSRVSCHSRIASRTLDGMELDSQKVEDCFSLFFEHYAPFLPILDSTRRPDLYYEQSQLLFWTIIATGSRRYCKDPTILGLLAGRVVNLALSSLAGSAYPLLTVTALLILCCWPFPVDSTVKELSPIFSGVALQIAVKNGLHIFGNGQDFARKMLWPDIKERTFRARLWSHCLIICQSTSICDGLPPTIVLDSFDFDRGQSDMIAALPKRLYFLRRVCKLQTNALSTIVRNGLSTEPAIDSSALSALIEIFDAQLQDLGLESLDEMDNLYLDCARLHTRAFHFLARADPANSTGFILLHSIARSVIERAVALDAAQNFALYCTNYVMRTILLAAFSILKISRSHLSQHINSRVGEQSYFSAIPFAKKRSLQTGDVDSRVSLILTQLWSSNKIFRQMDGKSNSLRLRTRSRLSVGVIFDCFWWWRAEFGGESNPYPDEPETSDNSAVTALPEVDSQLLSDTAMSFGCFPDWEWAAGLTFPTEGQITPELNGNGPEDFLQPPEDFYRTV